MGGFGTWALAATLPDQFAAIAFAAIAPICAGGEPIWGRRLAHLPIWVFHGAKDSTVPLRRSDDMVEAVKRHGSRCKCHRWRPPSPRLEAGGPVTPALRTPTDQRPEGKRSRCKPCLLRASRRARGGRRGRLRSARARRR